ncbi:MAG: putative manganese-dependent inorganic diphosphatase [Erysipelotrichaceae bacterium]|nr:putative manganese-dependent inorganic diphosphatase [Erysipelotrichaceae bacterium]
MLNTNLAIHVTGHKHPDTDSICSALAYANLKRKQGLDAIACRLGEVNHETSYILNRFGFEEPMVLNDARMTLSEIDLDEPVTISPETTIFEAWQIIQDEKKALVVVDQDQRVLGFVTNSDLSSIAMGDTAKSIELLQKTPISYIAQTLRGTLVYEPEKPRLNGKVSIIAVAEHKLENYELADRTVILGNDTEAQLQAIEKDAACLVVVWSEKINENVIALAKEKGCAIIISGHGTLNTSRYLYYSTPVRFIMSTDLLTFQRSEYVDDVLARLVKTRFRSYPVLDEKNHIYGLISRFHLLNARKKKIILVDHNEVSQSVDAVLDGDLMEVIDHHRIGDITTSKPIMFRNQLVGSTCTIIAQLYDEARVPLDGKMAGLLCAAIISDTLNFKSPTTTQTDINTGQRLARIAQVNTEDLAKDIFTNGSGLKDKSIEDIIEHDIKEFTLGKYRVMVGQMSLYDPNVIEPLRVDLVKAMKAYAAEKRLDLLMLLFTGLENNKSAVLYAGKESWIATDAFDKVSNDALVYYDVISRKKQVMPRLSAVVEGSGR